MIKFNKNNVNVYIGVALARHSKCTDEYPENVTQSHFGTSI